MPVNTCNWALDRSWQVRTRGRKLGRSITRLFPSAHDPFASFQRAHGYEWKTNGIGSPSLGITPNREFTTQDFPFCIQPIFQGTAFSAAPFNIELRGPCGSVGLGLQVQGDPRRQHVVRSPQVSTDLGHRTDGLSHQPYRLTLTYTPRYTDVEFLLA